MQKCMIPDRLLLLADLCTTMPYAGDHIATARMGTIAPASLMPPYVQSPRLSHPFSRGTLSHQGDVSQNGAPETQAVSDLGNFAKPPSLFMPANAIASVDGRVAGTTMTEPSGSSRAAQDDEQICIDAMEEAIGATKLSIYPIYR